MSRSPKARAAIFLALLLVDAPWASGAVSAEEAAALKTTLTPVGAERGGNAEGTIPSWDGGLSTAFPGFTPGAVRPDPFAEERPSSSITAKNIERYDDKLTDGTKALLKKYPETYRLDVYQTRRTAAFPASVYENSFKNAVTAHLVATSGGSVPTDAMGGVPFPIPRTGAEAIWNHLLRWRGGSAEVEAENYLGTADGKRVLVVGGASRLQQPYYSDADPSRTDAEYFWLRVDSDAPANKFGEAYLERSTLNAEKSNFWLYIPGQRRVRPLPNFCCDMALGSAGGALTFDEMNVWNGRIDRFEWKLVGKKEIYIPYNANRSARVTVDELLSAHHLNPDHIRWELHRVWVVDATLGPGKSHSVAKGRYYLDEDTWLAVLGDRWSANGQLIKTLWSLPLVMPDIPATTAVTGGGHDLVSGVWIAMLVSNGRSSSYKVVPRMPEYLFTPDAMAGAGVR